jgi:hypothetical protein
MTNQLESIDVALLSSVSGGAGVKESVSNAWQGTKNFAGGATAGLLHGVTAKNSQVDRFADGSSQATKAGFELGAMGNMAMGKVGDAVSWGADKLLPATEK